MSTSRRFRVGLTPMLGIIAIVAVEFAALRAGSQLWAWLMSTLTGVLLATSIVCVAMGHHKRYWSGFAAFGWTYVILSLVGLTNDGEPFLHPISMVVKAAAESLHPTPKPDPRGPGYVDREEVGALDYYESAFKLIAQSSGCLLFSFAGACFSTQLVRRMPDAGGEMTIPYRRPRRWFFIVLAGALACATILLALRSGALAWAVAFSLGTASLLATSALLVATGRAGRAWAGFAAFGWGYLLSNSLSNLAMDGYSRFHLRSFLKTAPNVVDDFLDRSIPYLHPEIKFHYFNMNDNSSIYRIIQPDLNGQPYHAIGHCVACLAFALAGALLARGLFLALRGPRTGRPSDDATTPSPMTFRANREIRP